MTQKTYSVYIHTTPNDKKYVGITTQKPEDRWINGLGYKKNTHFYRAIKKYGWNNINHEILFVNLLESEATEIEKELIKKYKTMNPNYGYNSTSGGEIGKTLTEQAKIKISENRKGIYSGKKHYCYGKHPTEWAGEEGFKKTIELARIRWSGENNPQKLNPRYGKDNHNFGKVYTKEEIWKKREAKKHLFKLNDEDVKNIYKLYFIDMQTYESIAKQYNISFGTVGNIIRREIYGHLDFPYIYEERHNKAKQDRIAKISKAVAKIDNEGKIIIQANSVKELSKMIDWSVAGITKHLKNRVKNPIFIYL